MSDGFTEGFTKAMRDVLVGIILSAIIGIIPTLLQAYPNIPTFYIGLFQLIPAIMLVGGLLIISSFESWGFWYLVGWLCAMWIMSSTGFVESWIFIVYIFLGVITLVYKFLKKL